MAVLEKLNPLEYTLGASVSEQGTVLSCKSLNNPTTQYVVKKFPISKVSIDDFRN